MPPVVKMFTLSTCPHCNKAKSFMKDCEVNYQFEDVDLLTGQQREQILEEVRKFNPACTFPTIVIGDKVIIGFNEEKIRAALGI